VSITQFDPVEWLVTATRSLGSYVTSKVNAATTDVEMSFPDTRDWTKDTPLAKSLIHFEQDHMDSPVWGFGNPGKEVFTESPDGGVTPAKWRVDEAQRHELNFDVGVWASAESGGATSRMRLVQLLANIFTVASAKQAMYDATGGLWVVSFTGGRNEIDRINDLPMWRALDMTLILRVFSKHPGVDEVVPDVAAQDQELTITDNAGNQVPVI
jgi:hypothetical protein